MADMFKRTARHDAKTFRPDLRRKTRRRLVRQRRVESATLADRWRWGHVSFRIYEKWAQLTEKKRTEI